MATQHQNESSYDDFVTIIIFYRCIRTLTNIFRFLPVTVKQLPIDCNAKTQFKLEIRIRLKRRLEICCFCKQKQKHSP